MKISGVDIRPGNIIEYEGGIWRAVKIQHTESHGCLRLTNWDVMRLSRMMKPGFTAVFVA